MEGHAVRGTSILRKGNAMSWTLRRQGRRAALWALTLAAAFALTGDRGRAQGAPTILGQDPLEILELKIRPNIVVVLDSSGSMSQTVDAASRETRSGDHPRSKMAQAKAVIRQVIQDNQDRVSFQFGTYTQFNESFDNQGAGVNRFQYSVLGTGMPSPELMLRRAVGDTGERGLQSWQLIYPPRTGPPAQAGWNRFYYEESIGGTTYACTATLPNGSGPNGESYYARGGKALTTDADVAGSLALALKTQINGCPRTGGRNVYDVTYAAGTGIFTITRTTNTNAWRPVWDRAPDNIRGALGRPATVALLQNVASYSTAVPYTLLYRTTGTGTADALVAPFDTGMDTQWTFSETIAGAATNVYQLAASRVWNGERIVVDTNGAVCNLTFGAMTNPPTIVVESANATCVASGTTATFTWAGGSFSGGTSAGNRSCRGFRSKSDLVPCDLKRPPAPLQIAQILPYVDGEIPFDTNGLPKDMTTNGAAYGSPGWGVPDGLPDYVEQQDGTWAVASMTIAPSAKADGFTPIANSLIEIKGLADTSNACITNAAPTPGTPDSVVVAGNIGACIQRGFDRLWNVGQAGTTNMAGPPPYQLDPIRNHRDPKEKTIVLFVTDGDDTCASRGSDGDTDAANENNRALRAAYHAERLYTPLDISTPANASASSIETFVIGYGGAFSGGVPTRLNWIAWGGSGLGQGQAGQPNVNTTGTNCQSRPGQYPLTGAGATGSCQWNDTAANLTALRSQCTTCRNAYVAPDAATLAQQMQGLIDQGAQVGQFSAQQSLTESVYEFVDLARAPTRNTVTAESPAGIGYGRYSFLVPTLIISSFTMPGFNGQLEAFQAVVGAGASNRRWSAGDKLRSLVAQGTDPAANAGRGNGMGNCDTTAAGGAVGLCAFAQLHGGETDVTIGSSSAAAIRRRIYTTTRNGVFDFTPETLMQDGTATFSGRLTLWPPSTAITPNSYTTQGSLDIQLGLPASSPTCTLVAPYTSCAWQEFERLQREFKACYSTILPPNGLPPQCYATTGPTNPDWPARMLAARREAREMMLAFMAGAEPVPSTTGLTRASTTSGGASQYALLYRAKSWVLADSELATPALIGPPQNLPPDQYGPEYGYYVDGVRDASDRNPDSGSAVVRGFGVKNPDSDSDAPDPSSSDPDPTDPGEPKPAMSVVYSPANDMLHAFRAGPSAVPALQCLADANNEIQMNPRFDCGGEELWGFVPYDQLGVLRLRYVNNPQTRANHVFMLARGVRFSDVFVPVREPDGQPPNRDRINVQIAPGERRDIQGVWRRIIFFGRGIGGKYLTALDVTGVGSFRRRANASGSPVPTGPIPLWSRGNPDTQDGTATGTNNGFGSDAAADRADYAFMGETWSMPAIAAVDWTLVRPNDGLPGAGTCVFCTERRPLPGPLDVDSRPHHVLYVGSGYSTVASEGSSIFTLDALSGDVIARAETGDRAGSPYENATPANVAAYNAREFVIGSGTHPSMLGTGEGRGVTRAYIGDAHGRFWKILSVRPELAIPASDLGATQPVGAAASVLAIPFTADISNLPANQYPHIFFSSGADKRVTAGPFKVFGLRDEGSNTATAVGASSTVDGVTTYQPVFQVLNRPFDAGIPEGNCGYTEEGWFRGTLQAAVAYECLERGTCSPDQSSQYYAMGRVFMGGTRLNLPNTRYAPPTPLACGTGQYPCRSQFDSIIYLLGAETGLPAYSIDGDTSGYKIFRDSRLSALTRQQEPRWGKEGGRGSKDEGQRKNPPRLPPVPAPIAAVSEGIVTLRPDPTGAPPGYRTGTSVCPSGEY